MMMSRPADILQNSERKKKRENLRHKLAVTGYLICWKMGNANDVARVLRTPRKSYRKYSSIYTREHAVPMYNVECSEITLSSYTYVHVIYFGTLRASAAYIVFS